jgi:hypothetical protein
MALTTTTDVATYCGVTGTTELPHLDMLRKGVEEAFKGLVGWRIEAATYTEFLNGTGTPDLFPRETPVVSITSVNVDQSRTFAAATLLTANTDYYLQMDGPNGAYSKSGRIVRMNSSWPKLFWVGRGNMTPLATPGQGNVKVVYAGGYTTIPDDMKLAIYEACKLLRMQRTTVGPIQSEGLGEYNYSAIDLTRLSQPFLRPGLEQTVIRYRRLRLQ